MQAQPFKMLNQKGYRFKDIDDKTCSIQRTAQGLRLGVNLTEGPGRMHLGEDEAIWLCQILLSYIETGDI